jgi:hypothetical protein
MRLSGSNDRGERDGICIAGIQARRRIEEQKKKTPRGSAQVFEKAQSRQENPRKSKPFSLMVFGWVLADFAGFG